MMDPDPMDEKARRAAFSKKLQECYEKIRDRCPELQRADARIQAECGQGPILSLGTQRNGPHGELTSVGLCIMYMIRHEGSVFRPPMDLPRTFQYWCDIKDYKNREEFEKAVRDTFPSPIHQQGW